MKKTASAHPFTERDREYLRSYYQIADMIADLVGPHAEVVLHTLEDMDRSVIKIVNGHHTGREVGSPVTDMALQMIQKYRQTGRHNSGSYFTRNREGKTLKSSTCILLNESNRAIGLLCVNINVSLPFAEIVKTLIPEVIPSIHTPEVFNNRPHDVITHAIDATMLKIAANTSIQKKYRTRAIVFSLYEDGIFELKDSARLVALSLGLTKNAIYKYLREFKSE
ncbi:TPA: transcriptional regulator [Klebsiella pneumoniae]